jgi:hypothetical protein
MKNTLAPITNSTNDTSSLSSSSHILMNRPPKLDVIPPGKREEKPKTEDHPQSPTPDQHQQKIDHHPQSPTLDQQEHQQKVEDRPQSPTPAQQEQRKVDDQQHIKDEEAHTKDLLKGKPILFISGGPGMKRNDFNISCIDFIIRKGSGKGTQCEKMIEKYGFTHLSAGDLIRAAAEDSTTEKGRYFNEAMSQGKLISTVTGNYY